ncbi:MAG: AmmeMemoRadiSam system protein B [Candidatus Omnitrophica bacterium]|nr:AmmeMemoRadiSam system protein B [Candidatus Omnitrophota bacterium]
MGLYDIRKASFAGQFYPSSAQHLKNQIESFIDKNTQKKDCLACLLPHAGYVYSGKVAAETVSRINLKETIILLGPNHTGYGAPYSIMTEGIWQTPLGDVKIDSVLANQILKNSEFLKEDSSAHINEHSLEVELPFFQYFKKDIKIVPITIMSEDTNTLKEIGEELTETIEQNGREDSVLIVASSDMTHYEPEPQAKSKDNEAIKAILELNENKLIEKKEKLNISMCGFAPAIAMIRAAKLLGAVSSELIRYQTSGETTGDRNSVVGYAGIIIY